LRCLGRVHQVRVRRPRGPYRLLDLDRESAPRVGLPLLHVGGVDTSRVRDSISTLDDRRKQQEVIVLSNPAGATPCLELVTRGVDFSRVRGSEVHPPGADFAARRREVLADESLCRRERRKLTGAIAEGRVGAVRDYIGTLKNVRRHQQVAAVHFPAFRLQCAADAGRSRERIVNRAGFDPTPFQGAQDERKQPRLVSDVPHDAKRARFLASPSQSVSL